MLHSGILIVWRAPLLWEYYFNNLIISLIPFQKRSQLVICCSQPCAGAGVTLWTPFWDLSSWCNRAWGVCPAPHVCHTHLLYACRHTHTDTILQTHAADPSTYTHRHTRPHTEQLSSSHALAVRGGGVRKLFFLAENGGSPLSSRASKHWLMRSNALSLRQAEGQRLGAKQKRSSAEGFLHLLLSGSRAYLLHRSPRIVPQIH